MKLENNTWTYEQYDLKKLNDHDLEIFWRIIQETWSFYFKEYVECWNCKKVYSKKDIYRKLRSDYRELTIEELEKQYWSDVKCCNCDRNTKHLWWPEYMQALEQSLTQNIYTNLVTFRNKANEVVWLTYSSVNTLQNIYDNDLSFDFSMSEFKNTLLAWRLDENFVLTTWLSIIEREKAPDIVNMLLAYLYKTFDIKYANLPWVLATIYRTQVYKLYRDIGVEDLGITSHSKQKIRLMYSDHIIGVFNKQLSSILE